MPKRILDRSERIKLRRVRTHHKVQQIPTPPNQPLTQTKICVTMIQNLVWCQHIGLSNYQATQVQTPNRQPAPPSLQASGRLPAATNKTKLG